MKAAIIGGTFNPIHIGHLFLAEEVLNEFDYDKVIFIPTNIPPHKTIITKVTTEQRMEMVKSAIKPYDSFICDDCEIKRGGISYTIDTIDYIVKKYKIEKIGYIIGDDLIEQFYTWKKAEEIANKVDLIIAHRLHKEEQNFDYKHRYINNFILYISSSEIRNRILNNKTIKFLLTKNVLTYIKRNKLYF